MGQSNETVDEIWRGDLLGRRSEADLIQKYIETEHAAFQKSGRDSSIVLALDAEYGEGKTWFLERLSKQLALTHPVARIDAWADESTEEPLAAFMSAIDDALAPFLRSSSKLRDKLARAKVAALPVMGRLVKGAMIKGLSKLAGDGAEDAIGDAFEKAVEKAKLESGEGATGISEAVEGGLEEVGKEIDALIDRRGAAMLAAYRQRRTSRLGFQSNMRDLVTEIDASEVPGRAPLVVIVDELDRCRPDYALKVLEEIKHFFEVQGVVFILAIHGRQLTSSVEAVYGPTFDAKSYMLRFFTRTYRMRRLSVAEIVESYFGSWEYEPKFLILDIIKGNSIYSPSPQEYISSLLDEYSVTPREVYPILDVLRLFSIDTGENELIHIHFLIGKIVRFVRGLDLGTRISTNGSMKFSSFEVASPSLHRTMPVTLNELLDRLDTWGLKIGKARFVESGRRPADNLAKKIFSDEFARRNYQQNDDVPSVIYTYEDRLVGILRLAKDVPPLENISSQ